MADIITGTVSGQVDLHSLHQDHADIRREIANAACETRADLNKGFERVNADVKDAGWKVSEKVSLEADRLAALTSAQFISTQDKFFALQKDVLEARAATLADGAATRELINSTSSADLRMQLLDARNQAERCIPRCHTGNGRGNGNGNGNGNS